MINNLEVIAEARMIKRDARQMRDAIAELDIFQSVFNMPCWFSDDQMLEEILAWISNPATLAM